MPATNLLRRRLLADGPPLDRDEHDQVVFGSGSGGKVLVTTAYPEQKTAWTKARRDVLHLLQADGYQILVLPALADMREWAAFAARLQRLAGRGGQIVIEYPFDRRLRAYPLRSLATVCGARLFAFVHDLDSLRHADSPPQRELAVLRLFNGVVSHNAAMTAWLREQGLAGPVVNLSLFDYLAPAARVAHAEALAWPLQVVSAGNLSTAKAGWLYDPALAGLRDVELSLFGAFHEPDKVPHGATTWKGVFDPDEPAFDRRYHFGLVWDGSSATACEGNYGLYTRYNNPHKLSLYLALGLPVIVWSQAACAPFVWGRAVGVPVQDLRDIGRVVRALGDEHYRTLAANAVRVGDRIRGGWFLRDALRRLERA